jgi:hypothetical protein
MINARSNFQQSCGIELLLRKRVLKSLVLKLLNEAIISTEIVRSVGTSMVTLCKHKNVSSARRPRFVRVPRKLVVSRDSSKV